MGFNGWHWVVPQVQWLIAMVDAMVEEVPPSVRNISAEKYYYGNPW